MLTPQEVSSRVFSKSMVGGYNMTAVDEFLDELTEDYTALYKENAALKTKLKVMVDKVEDYRATEDSMRAALLAAQKMAESMVADAEKKKAELLGDVSQEVQKRKAELDLQLQQEQLRLDTAKKATGDFLSQLRGLYQQQLQLLDQLPQEEFAVSPSSQPEQQDTAEAIEESIRSAFTREFSDEETSSQETEETVEAPAAAASEQQEEPHVEELSSDSIFDDFQTTRRLNINELKFGRNYGSPDQK